MSEQGELKDAPIILVGDPEHEEAQKEAIRRILRLPDAMPTWLNAAGRTGKARP